MSSSLNKIASASLQRGVKRIIVRDKEGNITADVDCAQHILPETGIVVPRMQTAPVKIVGCKWCGCVPYCTHRPKPETPRPPLPPAFEKARK